MNGAITYCQLPDAWCPYKQGSGAICTSPCACMGQALLGGGTADTSTWRIKDERTNGEKRHAGAD